MSMDKYDIYCEEILSWALTIDIIYESDLVLAFYHTKPFYEKHLVVIPKECILDLYAIKVENISLLQEIHKAVKICIATIWYTTFETGVKVITNHWKWQHTPHLHFHIVCGNKIW